MVIGVSDDRVAPTVIGVLQRRQMVRAMVVHGHDGMDELTLTGPSTVHELRDGEVHRYEVDPAALGLTVVPAAQVAGGDGAANAEIARRVLDGEPGPYRDIVLLNAAAGLVVGGAAADLAEGIELARASIDGGKARAVLDALVVSIP
jgi:anthranilate phosphoribosyltransferase